MTRPDSADEQARALQLARDMLVASRHADEKYRSERMLELAAAYLAAARDKARAETHTLKSAQIAALEKALESMRLGKERAVGEREEARAAALEEAAGICDHEEELAQVAAEKCDPETQHAGIAYHSAVVVGAARCADAIRARALSPKEPRS